MLRVEWIVPSRRISHPPFFVSVDGDLNMPRIQLPGLIDAHVHLRDPGGTHKEDFHTGTCAALHGGVVTVLAMPNETPPIIDAQSMEQKARIAGQKAVCDYGLFAGATVDNSGSVNTLAGAVGLKMYLNETFGPLKLEGLPSLIAHFRAWPRGRPVAVHAEGYMVAAVIAMAQLFSRHVHVCHVARRGEIELVRRAKERGVDVTCEVTPHHLLLSQEDICGLGPLALMKPSLGTSDDRNALWENLAVVDLVASDHAPHTLDEKCPPHTPPGVPGLETMLPLLLTAVAEGQLSLERLGELTSLGPARVYHLRLTPESCVTVQTDASYELTSRDLFTKCAWTPFEGWRVRGRVLRTTVRGTVAYDDGRVLVAPGFGQRVCPYPPAL